jgi:hypothetical protein
VGKLKRAKPANPAFVRNGKRHTEKDNKWQASLRIASYTFAESAVFV